MCNMLLKKETLQNFAYFVHNAVFCFEEISLSKPMNLGHFEVEFS